MAAHVVIEPEGAAVPAGETDSPVVSPPGGGANPAPGPELGEGPVVTPAVVRTNTTVTKTTVSIPSKHKASASAASSRLPKTDDSHLLAVSLMLFVLGTAVLAATYCR